MKVDLEGFGRVIIEGNIDGNGTSSGANVISITTEATVNLFRKYSILKSRIAENALGLYSFYKADRNRKVKLGSFNTPRHVLSGRKGGCGWNPKGDVSMSMQTMTLDPFESQNELCPDFAYESCFKSIYAGGNGVRDLTMTAEGTALFMEMLRVNFIAKGNSLYEALDYGQHPYIDKADAATSYTETDSQWTDYKDQQLVTKGVESLIYNLKTVVGLENLSYEISDDNVSADQKKYIGTVTDLFDEAIENMPLEIQLSVEQGQMNGLYPVIEVSGPLFNKYREELLATHNGIPETFNYYMTGSFAGATESDATRAVKNVLWYQGYPIYRNRSWDDFDRMLGTKTFRLRASVPGNYAIGYDVMELDHFGGLGMVIEQSTRLRDQGKIYMDTTFEAGAAIIAPELITQYEKVFYPAGWVL